MAENFAVFHVLYRSNRGKRIFICSHCFGILFTDHVQDLTAAESDDEQEGRASPRPLIFQSSHQDAITGGKKWQLTHNHSSHIGKRWEGERCHHIRAKVIPNGSMGKCDPVETHKGESVFVFNSGVRIEDFVYSRGRRLQELATGLAKVTRLSRALCQPRNRSVLFDEGTSCQYVQHSRTDFVMLVLL